MKILSTPQLAAEMSKRKLPRPRGVSYQELAEAHDLLGNRFTVDCGGGLINQTLRESIQAQMGVRVFERWVCE
jgi:hypothetical protein